jgi:uncharacterized repeat protein (TIGR03806 family)
MALLLIAALAGCSQRPEVRLHGADAYPEHLSAWGLMVRDGRSLVLGQGVVPYEVNAPLFTDYALKLRTYYLPDGGQMVYQPDDSFDFPVGSVITKTFFYPHEAGVVQAAEGGTGDVAALDLSEHRLMETRLLVRQADGWHALPYVWEGDDAVLTIIGAVTPLQLSRDDQVETFPYLVPARSECASCHATDHADGRLQPIGMTARQLNRDYPGQPGNQLTRWADDQGLVDLPEAAGLPYLPPWNAGEAIPADQRARSYLDGNCGHCHSARGPAKTSGLLLDAATIDHRQLGLCKPPIAAGRGTGGRRYSVAPGEPDGSILLYRMDATDPAIRMPELGRVLVHREGVALIRSWIEGLRGQCVSSTPG